MLFPAWAISVVLTGVALFLYEKDPSTWHMRMIWLTLLNAIGVAGINLMYFIETRL